MFASAELPLRQKLSYPPFATMIRLVVRGESEEVVKHFAVQIVETIRTVLEKHGGKARLLGPAPAPIAKIKGKYRYQVQLQALDGDMLRQVTREATEILESPPEVFFTVDVDPIDML
jgi:primosomal protein N' (replication factor Y)